MSQNHILYMRENTIATQAIIQIYFFLLSGRDETLLYEVPVADGAH